MRAIHVPTGTAYSANDVPDDRRAGPWKCAAVSCGVPVFHARAGRRRNPSGGDPIAVSAKFSCFHGRKHDTSVLHDAPAQRPRHASRTEDERRRHTHLLTDLPVADRPVTEPKPRGVPGHERATYEYGEPVHGVAGLARLSVAIRRNPAIATEEQFRHDGVDYWWDELAYMSESDDYDKLDRRIRAQFNVSARAYYVEGVAKYRAFPTDVGGRLQIHLMSALEPDAREIHVFMPDEAEFRDAVVGIRRGTNLALFSRSPSVLSKTDEPALSIESADQLMAWEG